MSNRNVSYKDLVTKSFPKAECVWEEGKGFKILSKEPKGKRILSRGKSAWSAWKIASETSVPLVPAKVPPSTVTKTVVIPANKPQAKTPLESFREGVKEAQVGQLSNTQYGEAKPELTELLSEKIDVEVDDPEESSLMKTVSIIIMLVIIVSLIVWQFNK